MTEKPMTLEEVAKAMLLARSETEKGSREIYATWRELGEWSDAIRAHRCGHAYFKDGVMLINQPEPDQSEYVRVSEIRKVLEETARHGASDWVRCAAIEAILPKPPLPKPAIEPDDLDSPDDQIHEILTHVTAVVNGEEQADAVWVMDRMVILRASLAELERVTRIANHTLAEGCKNREASISLLQATIAAQVVEIERLKFDLDDAQRIIATRNVRVDPRKGLD